MTDDELRAAFRNVRFPVLAGEPLAASLIWDAVHGELSPERTADVVDRVAADPEAAPDVASENRAAQRAARRMLERGPRF